MRPAEPFRHCPRCGHGPGIPGGFVEEDETAEQSVLRETREEDR